MSDSRELWIEFIVFSSTNINDAVWRKLVGSDWVHVSEGILTISNATSSDSGMYECRPKSGPDPEQRKIVQVDVECNLSILRYSSVIVFFLKTYLWITNS